MAEQHIALCAVDGWLQKYIFFFQKLNVPHYRRSRRGLSLIRFRGAGGIVFYLTRPKSSKNENLYEKDHIKHSDGRHRCGVHCM